MVMSKENGVRLDAREVPVDGPRPSLLPGIVARKTVCKCCGAASSLSGLVDFSRCGADLIAQKKIDPYVGFPIYYYRCDQCGFTFTSAFDEWSTEMFGLYIYNDDYPRHDPDYRDKRPTENAGTIAANFPEMAAVSVLDYGSGMGLLEEQLKRAGFTDVVSYDPYSAPTRPDRQFDAILSFEVFEHHPQPQALFADLVSLMKADGAVLLSTQLIGDEVHAVGVHNWWYCAPRNGHISFYSAKSLALLAARHGLRVASFNAGLHVIFGQRPPAWLAKFVGG